jgi:hypothetical protein
MVAITFGIRSLGLNTKELWDLDNQRYYKKSYIWELWDLHVQRYYKKSYVQGG